jgi:hypothetical protein
MRHWLSALAVVSIAAAQGFSATGTRSAVEPEAGCATPRDLQDGWSITAPQQHALDPARRQLNDQKRDIVLVGIAVDRGLIRDLDAPVFSFFPEYADLRTPEKDRVTLRHLPTMSAGWEGAFTSPTYRLILERDLRQRAWPLLQIRQWFDRTTCSNPAKGYRKIH